MTNSAKKAKRLIRRWVEVNVPEIIISSIIFDDSDDYETIIRLEFIDDCVQHWKINFTIKEDNIYIVVEDYHYELATGESFYRWLFNSASRCLHIKY